MPDAGAVVVFALLCVPVAGWLFDKASRGYRQRRQLRSLHMTIRMTGPLLLSMRRCEKLSSELKGQLHAVLREQRRKIVERNRRGAAPTR
jgi:hypothetical protein